MPAWAFDALAGAGALWSTTRDMAKLARRQLQAAPRALAHEIGATREIVAPATAGYAVTRAWHVADTPEGPVFWHNGATAGHRSFFGFRPATDEAVVLLAAGELDPAGLALDWFGFSGTAQAVADIDSSLEGQYRLTPQVGPGEGFAELEEFRSIWESSGGRSHHRTATGYLAISRSGVTSV